LHSELTDTRFWKRAGYIPLYIRQTQSELTGENTCVMVRGLNTAAPGELDWLSAFAKDFRRRFVSLLSFKFRKFGSVLGLSMLEAASAGITEPSTYITAAELDVLLSPFDLKRMEAYAQNTLDYHVILDLLPAIATLYFEKRLGDDLRLSAIQSSILLGMGLQRKSVEDVERELQLPVSQALALFVKLIRKISGRLNDVRKEVISAEISLPPRKEDVKHASVNAVRSAREMEEELREAGEEVTGEMREKQRAMIDAPDLSRCVRRCICVLRHSCSQPLPFCAT
jgi:N-acetyltransferase 10